MSIEEYFGEWMKVIDRKELIYTLKEVYKTDRSLICPNVKNIFRAFELCSYKDCIAVFIGQDPYPQKGVAQGILFGNSNDTPEDDLSPSLKVIKECVINFGIPHNIINFDNSLESWCRQGILMINSALTCEVNKIGSHVNLWRPFMTKFISNMSQKNQGIVYVLFGKQAQTLKPYINKSLNDIIEIEHPAYFARTGKQMPNNLFTDINKLLYGKYGTRIEWFKEEEIEYQ